MTTNKPIVLILCTGNSIRSHMAEAFLHTVAGNVVNAQSAGTKPKGFPHPWAIKVMQEVGIDISNHRSKHVDEFIGEKVETVITVCGNANQDCPIFPGLANRYHWGFDDPADATGSEDEKLAVFRRVRDEIQRVFTAYGAGRLDSAKK
jgi:arsenate reductase